MYMHICAQTHTGSRAVFYQHMHLYTGVQVSMLQHVWGMHACKLIACGLAHLCIYPRASHCAFKCAIHT
jgi:hypothetical protein